MIANKDTLLVEIMIANKDTPSTMLTEYYTIRFLAIWGVITLFSAPPPPPPPILVKLTLINPK